MEKTKIVHILHAVGGVDVSLRLILESINPDKFENVIIHGIEDTDKPYSDKNNKTIKTYRLPILRNISLIKDFKSLRRIKKILSLEQPDLIHAHSAKGGVLGKISGFMVGIPVLHTPQAYSYLSAQNGFKKGIFLSIEKLAAKLNNKILASSYSEKNRAIDEVGYPENRVEVFSNSIKPINSVQDLTIEETWPKNYICSVGRPSYQKNIEFMVEVIAEVKKSIKDIHLVLMGVGFHSPNLEAVKQKIESYQLKDNITLLEWTKREDIFHIIKNSSLYISTARYEGLPYSIIESLALSKACVVTDADGNRDLIEHNQNGFVIFENNVQDFKEKIITILENDDLRKTFEKNSFQKFNQFFNIEVTIKKLEKIYINNRKR
ncbi:glycosyltransferase [Mesonia mobilis]|uniref:Glycosyl transferase family 1 n=1 Tax=Mesonia mobilis TaxID=369791 RepID=A0ABQ3BXD1_9FLAO|nr:glycosyltransferase [Mesonia mobilis]MBQ0737652.1 glycosyltransferase [Aquimarina celericrescens]GGZ60402.1 glycosyl transferase family 1 [Mesonia mobilis]